MTALHVEIRVAGSVPAAVLEELEDLHVSSEQLQTVLRGPVQDQAALIGIINRLQDWGIELHSIQQLQPGEALGPRTETADRPQR